jgi:FkbM family methyltransferase
MFKLLCLISSIKSVNHPAFSFWEILSTWLGIKFSQLTYSSGKSSFKTRLFGKKWVGLDPQTVNYVFKEVFINEEYRIENLSTSPLIVDCGSNIGTSLLYFKKLYPESKIIGFEANPIVYSLLEQNITYQELSNVEIHPVALFDKETELIFYTGSSNQNLMGSLFKKRGGANEVNVKTKLLSQFLLPYDKVDVVKIDVEGAEWNVLTDLTSSNSLQKVQNFLIEYHLNMPGEQGKLSQFIKIFEDHGYKYSIKGKFSTPGEFQDLLLHFVKMD